MTSGHSAGSLAAYCLLLPGKQLHLSALLAAKKFRGRGNKGAALAAFRELEAAGLGKLTVQDSRRGTSAVRMYICVFTYIILPDTEVRGRLQLGIARAEGEGYIYL